MGLVAPSGTGVTGESIYYRHRKKIWVACKEMTEYIELGEPVEKLKVKKVLSDKQRENLAKGRAVKQGKISDDMEAKSNKKLEARFDRLLELFDQVKMPAPEVQAKARAKRAPPPTPESSDDEESREPPIRVIEKARPVVHVQPTKQIFFSFK
jgi:hypothetical protein